MKRRILTTVLLIVLLAGVMISLYPFLANAAATSYYVAPNGSDANHGTSSEAPLQSIQKAVDLAEAGDSIHLAPGDYFQDLVSQRDGAPGAPITITGPADAVVRGEGNSRIFQIHHDHMTLDGFTIDGQYEDGKYRNKLLYVLGKEHRSGVTGLRVLNMNFRNAGGECVRLRYFAQHNEIAFSRFIACGIDDFVFGGGGKNGEGLYIGTAPEQLRDGKNPTSDRDESNNNWIHNNYFDTQGNECVDIKESSSGNIVEYNECTGQKDPKSGGLDARGSGNVFRYNEVYGNLGAGVRLGGDDDTDGVNNDVYDNRLYGNKNGGIKFQRMPQGQICGNNLTENNGGDAVGAYREHFAPASTCEPDLSRPGGPMPMPEIPTEVPPTAEPTVEIPTEVPPTEVPTDEPTVEIPTEVPTDEPTVEIPTEVPPTEVPTDEPTVEIPTEVPPTEVPTDEPTVEIPTEVPSLPTDPFDGEKDYSAVLDTYISSQDPDSAYPNEASLKVDQTPQQWSFLRFEIPDSASVQRAQLRMYVNNESDQGGAVHAVPAGWDGSLTWNSRPVLGTKLADIGPVQKGDWVTVDVTAALQPDGVVTLALLPQSEDAAGYRSRENNDRDMPILVIERRNIEPTSVPPTAMPTDAPPPAPSAPTDPYPAPRWP